MGFFSRKKQETAGLDYCLFCGMDLVQPLRTRGEADGRP